MADRADMKVSHETRRRLKVEAAKYGESYDETINRLLDAIGAEPPPGATV